MRSAILSTLAVALALVAPAATAPPKIQPGPYETCTKKSTRLTNWIVQDFSYSESRTFSTPAHQISSGSLHFVLDNPATNYTVSCRARSQHLDVFFLGDVTYECDVQGSEQAATFTFSRPTGRLNIGQSWTCQEEETRFTAKGGVTLDLQCKTIKWKNDDWREGSIYSSEDTQCDPVTVPATIDTLSVVG